MATQSLFGSCGAGFRTPFVPRWSRSSSGRWVEGPARFSATTMSSTTSAAARPSGPRDARVYLVNGIRALAFALVLAGLRMSSA